MEMQQNKSLFHRTCSDLVTYLFYQNILKYFNDFQNQYLSISWLQLTQEKSDIFSWDIFKSDIIFHWSQNYKIFQ